MSHDNPYPPACDHIEFECATECQAAVSRHRH